MSCMRVFCDRHAALAGKRLNTHIADAPHFAIITSDGRLQFPAAEKGNDRTILYNIELSIQRIFRKQPN